jgi:hypothetical protein
MLDRPRVVTHPPWAPTHLDMANTTPTNRAWDQALRYRLQNRVRSQTRGRKSTRGVSRWPCQGGARCLTRCIAMNGWHLARLIPGFQALPELLVFRCPHCGHVETLEQPVPKGRSN